MKTNTRTVYKQLMAKTRDLIVLDSAEGIIHWDMETMMPPRAVEQRSLQLALLSRISHKMSTDPQIGKLLKQITANPDYDKLDQTEKRNLQLIKKHYDEQTALPEELVAETARQQAITVNIWKKAKKTKNYALLKPDLTKLVNLAKRAAEILMKVKETATPYDALIDIYEPKMTTNAININFDKLQKGLITLLEKIQNSPNQPDTNILHQNVPVETQRKIVTVLAETLGYDTTTSKAAGRIDETEHPFTSGYYDDVRITTHFYPNDYASSIFSILHETGHALYEQNLNPEWKYQPIGSSCSMGIHESQSRFVENIIGRSEEFWTHILPKLKEVASPNLANLELEEFIRAINAVKPSKIRVEADEVTYNLHVIIRFQIEKDLFADKIEVSELPSLWNQKYHEYLSLKIKDDAEGVMQDTHWPSGLYGYFPTYTLGNIYSGQILAKIQQEQGDWRREIAKGNLKNVTQWLTKNVHTQSDLYDPADLMKKITGKKLDAEPYLEYLRAKYAMLYDF
jgi:carboxypeptidase Taq